MKTYIAVLGRQPLLSLAELEAQFGEVRRIAPELAEFRAAQTPDIRRLGGTLKIAEATTLASLIDGLPKEGKITIGISDFTKRTTAFLAQKEALSIKRQLVRQGRSVRVVPNQTAVLSNAVSLHNHLIKDRKIELLKLGKQFYQVIALSNIESYAQRDQKRPARDARVGMLPPKLAQMLINLCGDLPAATRLLDPFCGTGVVLQEALLMGYQVYGTDLEPRMVEYTKKNLQWLGSSDFTLAVGDATTYQWSPPIGAVACETYLGPPMSQPPAEIKLKEVKQLCQGIILNFLKNLASQIPAGTPVVIAVPAWLRPSGEYSRLNLLDEIDNLRYNVHSFKNVGQNDLLYHREGQVVAREIIVLRKK